MRKRDKWAHLGRRSQNSKNKLFSASFPQIGSAENQ